MTDQTFSQLDAQMILEAAQNAPLQNMKHAQRLTEAVSRYVEHVNAHFTPAPVPDLPPAVPRKRRTNAEIAAAEAAAKEPAVSDVLA